jgi:hypothetical protein
MRATVLHADRRTDMKLKGALRDLRNTRLTREAATDELIQRQLSCHSFEAQYQPTDSCYDCLKSQTIIS